MCFLLRSQMVLFGYVWLCMALRSYAQFLCVFINLYPFLLILNHLYQFWSHFYMLWPIAICTPSTEKSFTPKWRIQNKIISILTILKQKRIYQEQCCRIFATKVEGVYLGVCDVCVITIYLAQHVERMISWHIYDCSILPQGYRHTIN